MILLADTTPDPKDFWQFILGIAFLCSIGANIAIIVSARRTQKREIAYAFTPASKEEFDKAAKENDADHTVIHARLTKFKERTDELVAEMREEMRHDREAALQSGEERSNKIHSRIDDVLRAVSRLEGKLNK